MTSIQIWITVQYFHKQICIHTLNGTCTQWEAFFFCYFLFSTFTIILFFHLLFLRLLLFCSDYIHKCVQEINFMWKHLSFWIWEISFTYAYCTVSYKVCGWTWYSVIFSQMCFFLQVSLCTVSKEIKIDNSFFFWWFKAKVVYNIFFVELFAGEWMGKRKCLSKFILLTFTKESILPPPTRLD